MYNKVCISHLYVFESKYIYDIQCIDMDSRAKVSGRQVANTPVKVCLPHEMLHCLSQTVSPFVWSSALLGHLGEGSRRAFFEHLETLQPWKNHPAFQRPDVDYERLIPLCIHGDGAQFFKNDENFIWSFSSSFSCRGSIKDVMAHKWPIAIIPERFMRDPEVAHISDWHVLLLFSQCVSISESSMSCAMKFNTFFQISRYFPKTQYHISI